MPTFDTTKQIFLCGLPSVGKTYFGKFLAQFLSLPFFDTDHLLSSRFQGDSPKIIYQRYGEKGFCQEELSTLISVPMIPSVVALGGNTLINEQAYEHVILREKAILVLLDISIPTLCQRLQQRPLPERLKNVPSLEEALFQRLTKLRALTTNTFLLQTAHSPQCIEKACQAFASCFLNTKEVPRV